MQCDDRSDFALAKSQSRSDTASVHYNPPTVSVHSKVPRFRGGLLKFTRFLPKYTPQVPPQRYNAALADKSTP